MNGKYLVWLGVFELEWGVDVLGVYHVERAFDY
jgi:hypothetical protein